jgi:predicted GIY-YIG superfamily endonuclease
MKTVWLHLLGYVMAANLMPSGSLLANDPSPPAIDQQTIARVFQETHDGWSVDEVLLDDDRRQELVEAIRQSTDDRDLVEIDEKVIFESLIKLRKSGKLQVKTTRTSKIDLEAELPAAEIAARSMQDRHSVHMDEILVDPVLLTEFDSLATRIAPESRTYLLRKAALCLRKSRRLKPELTLRVTDWKRSIEELSLQQAKEDIGQLSTRPGIYIFRDETGFLYIGQSQNLQQRLAKHLEDSDRKNLTKYLSENSNGAIVVELHIFEEGSPAEKLAVREAYESELIRSRKPRLNIAP